MPATDSIAVVHKVEAKNQSWCHLVTLTRVCVHACARADGALAAVFPWNCDSDWKYQSFDLTQERSPSLNPCLPSDSPTLRPTEVCRGKPQTPPVIGGERVGGGAAQQMVDSWYGTVVLLGNILCSLSYVLYQEF